MAAAGEHPFDSVAAMVGNTQGSPLVIHREVIDARVT